MTKAELKALADSILAAGQTTDLIALLLTKAKPAFVAPSRIVGPFRARDMLFPEVGSSIMGHMHNYPHTMVASEGSVLVQAYPCGEDRKPLHPDKPAEENIVGGPGNLKEIVMRRDAWHKVTSLTAGAVMSCYFVHRDDLGRVVMDYNKREASYA